MNNMYLTEGNLHVQELGRGFAWLDTGTHDSLMEAGQFVQTVERRQGFKVACLEEIAYKNGWIDKGCLQDRAKLIKSPAYRDYLIKIADGY